MGLTVNKVLEFPPKTHESTMKRVNALAWATNRRGRNNWEGKTVIADIQRYLVNRDIHMDRNDVRYAIRWIVNAGYGWDKRADDPAGTTIGFNFHPNVNLNVSKPVIPEPVVEEDEVQAQPTNIEAKLDGIHFDVPVPGEPAPVPEPETYKLDEITVLLKGWAKHDPDAYADWADRTLSSLGALSGK